MLGDGVCVLPGWPAEIGVGTKAGELAESDWEAALWAARPESSTLEAISGLVKKTRDMTVVMYQARPGWFLYTQTKICLGLSL